MKSSQNSLKKLVDFISFIVLLFFFNRIVNALNSLEMDDRRKLMELRNIQEELAKLKLNLADFENQLANITR